MFFLCRGKNAICPLTLTQNVSMVLYHSARSSQYISLNTGKRLRYMLFRSTCQHTFPQYLSVQLYNGYGVLMPVDHVVQRPGSPHTSRVIKLGPNCYDVLIHVITGRYLHDLSRDTLCTLSWLPYLLTVLAV